MLKRRIPDRSTVRTSAPRRVTGFFDYTEKFPLRANSRNGRDQDAIDLYLSSDRDSIAVDRGRARDGLYIIMKGIALIDRLRQLIDAR